MSILNKQWKYINEGNKHIVLQIFDTSYVVRLIKDVNNRKIDYIETTVDFVNLVMLPLICKDTAYKEEIIYLSQSEITELLGKLLKVRPNNRIHKASISHYALKAPNLAIINPDGINYCIEIKTKEGFLAESLKEYAKCYYCLKQHLKLSEKQISKVSGYCPLDLYSGNKRRMKVAITSLLQNPQNNFKIFKNCDIVFNEHSNYHMFEQIINATILGSVNVFLDFIVDILLSDGLSNIKLVESAKIDIEQKQKCHEDSMLPQSSFLFNLLQIQQISNKMNLNPIPLDDSVSIFDLSNYVKENNLNFNKNADRNHFINTAAPLHLAIISAVAKDCSIMITFTEHPCEGYPTVLFEDKKLSYRISVTDLEPKSVKSLIKRNKTEQTLKKLISTSENN